MDKKLFKKAIKDMEKQMVEQQKIVDRLKKCLKPIGEIKDFSKIKVSKTSNVFRPPDPW